MCPTSAGRPVATAVAVAAAAMGVAQVAAGVELQGQGIS